MNPSFHNSIDQSLRPYQAALDGVRWGNLDTSYFGGRWKKSYSQKLNYQFFLHLHPYVSGNRAALAGAGDLPGSLLQRMITGGLSQLQTSDTLYLPQPNPPAGLPMQPLTVMPGSTRAVLAASTTATRTDGSNITLSAGTPLTLPDGVAVRLAAGTMVARTDGTSFTLGANVNVTLPAKLPVSFANGNQWHIAGVDTIVGDGTEATLPGGAGLAVLAGDGSSINLPAGTKIRLRSGMPQPFFYEKIFDNSDYDPNPGTVNATYPVKNIDFTYNGAYSLYNWEIFFHAPLLIAVHLSQNQQFKDAQTWFHYIFNPTDNSPGPTPERFWQVQPFQYTDTKKIAEILVNLSTNQDPALYQATINSISDWKQHPFQPWEVAKYRPTAYMLKTVMAYLDNLIAWGDSLFQQYTIETINEATQLYILAANILGNKPQAVPSKGESNTFTYNQLRGKLDAFGNTLVEMEADMPFDIAPLPGAPTPSNGTQILAGIGQTLYFCVPCNQQMLAYWDTVADRLFKIHNSLNLQGVFQRLPLFDPPIDPAMLVRAAAAGLDVSAIVSGLNQPLPLVRFRVLLDKATEICREAETLGANLLSAIEKKDNETLALLRAQHESTMANLAQMVKYAQWQEAIKNRQNCEVSITNATQRYHYYQTILGRTDAQIQASLPQLAALDIAGLNALGFSQSDASSEPTMALDPINPDIAGDSLEVSDGGVSTMSNHEVKELDKLGLSRDFQIAASAIEAVGSGLAMVPQFKAHAQPMGCGLTVDFGGQHLHSMMSGLASVSRAFAEEFTFESNKAGKLGNYARREMEWTYQSNLAKSEINQIYKQLRAAQIREAIAEKEYNNHLVQMANAQQIVDYLQGNDVGGGVSQKESTVGFYAWMKREVKKLYSNVFQLAFETAKKAERALQNELGNSALSFIQFNYLDGNQGLLAGEKLMLDLKTMEMAYHDLNQREYEMTKHISLRDIAPHALMQLRTVGHCLFVLPEDVFDMDGPGHYFRRIKSIALTVPCVAGPYSSVNCTLTLQSSSIRINADAGDAYARKNSDDIRFNDYYGSMQSIVTSNGQADSGLFETNLKDDRYLPFEGSGIATSQWQLSLPSDVRQFSFDTVSDVILHVRYTAREGGDLLKAAAVKNLQANIKKGQSTGSVRLFSMRHDFPNVWAKFRSVTIDGSTPTAALSLTLTPELYPTWAQGIVGNKPLKAVEFFAATAPGNSSVNVSLYDKADKTGNTDLLGQNPVYGKLLNGTLSKITLPAAISDATHPGLNVFFDNNQLEDVWVALTWGG